MKMSVRIFVLHCILLFVGSSAHASAIIPDDVINQAENVSRTTGTSELTECDALTKYRTYDGTCNNLLNPLWGSARTCFQRLLPARYEGFSGILDWGVGGPLPHPLELAKSVERSPRTKGSRITSLHLYFGQFVAHDISYSVEYNKDGVEVECCPPMKPHPECIPIYYELEDPFDASDGEDKSLTRTKCLSFRRSVACADDKNSGSLNRSTTRNQMNAVTSFLDLSVVYNNDEVKANLLRALDGTGKLKITGSSHGEQLPTANVIHKFCFPDKTCFTGGDSRLNQHAILTSFQTLLLREHNRIAHELHRINPMWDDETLFQESRRILIAAYQAIVYKEYIPELLGHDISSKFDLLLKEGTTEYDQYLNPTAFNEHAAAAARLAHSRLGTTKPRCGFKVGKRNLLLEDLYPEHLAMGALEPLLESITWEPLKGCDREYDSYNYRLPGIPHRLELAMKDILRGRDHGLGSYADMVRFCTQGKVLIEDFDDLPQLIAKERLGKIAATYRSVKDIEMWAGIIAEENIPDGITPTSACIQAMLFRSLKYGDRFYFQHRNTAGNFSTDQLTELLKASFSRIICDNTGVRKIMLNSMVQPTEKNPMISCEDIPHINLSYWKVLD